MKENNKNDTHSLMVLKVKYNICSFEVIRFN